ncbi:MAG TPA: hypothetical protein VGA03_13600, partial [Anaerolineales bacterium]
TCVRASEAAYQKVLSMRMQAEGQLQAYLEQTAALESTRQEAVGRLGEHQAGIARLQAQIEVLVQAEQALAGYASGARLLLQAAREARLEGVRGALSGSLDVPAALEVAIAAALGEFLDAVVLEEGADLEAALAILQEGGARGVLLPMGRLKPGGRMSREARDGQVLGVAADLVTGAGSIRTAVDLLLGDVLVVRDREAAREVLGDLEREAGDEKRGVMRVVTLKGEVYHTHGPVVAGQEGKPGTLSRPRQRRELNAQLGEAENREAVHEDQIRQMDDELEERRTEGERLAVGLRDLRREEEKAGVAHSQDKLKLEQAERDLHWQEEQLALVEKEIQDGLQQADRLEAERAELDEAISQAQNDLRERVSALAELAMDEIQAQVAHWGMRAAVVEQAAANARARFQERREALETARQQLQDSQARLEEIEATRLALEGEKSNLRQAEGEIGGQIEALRASIEPAEKELDDAEAEQVQLQGEEARSRHALNMAEHHHAQAKISLAKRQETLDTLRRRIEDDFGLVAFEYDEEVSGQAPLPFDGMVEELPRVSRLSPETEEALKRQRALLRRMGPVNPEAQAEYREVKERYEFLTSQVDDLNQAEADVRQVIAELDELMQREFQRTFEAVAIEFRQIFGRLFGGGSARLVLTDPDDLTLTGIDIEARLPGRREQGLSLLSGGERSLTAVALVFALLRVSPTPFCILDEVDAMLDEANVGRFRELLRELSATTQFILITHNRNTVQVADVIYGVTMGRDSASQLVSLKLDEVEKVVPD